MWFYHIIWLFWRWTYMLPLCLWEFILYCDSVESIWSSPEHFVKHTKSTIKPINPNTTLIPYLCKKDHCTSIRIGCEQSICTTCLCFFTKASSLGGLGFCIKLLFTSGSWTVLSRTIKEKKHQTKSSIKPSFLHPNSLTLTL